jgi:hypothetical protein
MFYSGQGTLSDAVTGVLDLLLGEEPTSYDFATTGRRSMNDALLGGLDEAYWFGPRGQHHRGHFAGYFLERDAPAQRLAAPSV